MASLLYLPNHLPLNGNVANSFIVAVKLVLNCFSVLWELPKCCNSLLEMAGTRNFYLCSGYCIGGPWASVSHFTDFYSCRLSFLSGCHAASWLHSAHEIFCRAKGAERASQCQIGQPLIEIHGWPFQSAWLSALRIAYT